MFAILLSKSMDPFYQNISSFPTAVFTFILAICALYWLLAVFGVVDIDIIDLDGLDTDMGSDVATADALTGIMLKFGLHGVPVTIIISFLSLFGWLASYYSVHFLSPLIPGGMLHALFDVLVLIATFWLAVLLTTIVIKPLRPLFKKAEQQTVRQILGKSVVVRTSKVTDSFGEAFLTNDGVDLILKVRSSKEQTFKKGDKVVLLEYFACENTYLVIAEQDFHI